MHDKTFHPPPPCLPSEYAVLELPPPQEGAEYLCWWTSLGDPVLNSLVNEAACENRTLREAALKVIQYRERYAMTRGGLWPKLAGTTGYSHRETSLNANQFVIPQNLQRSYDFYTFGFDASWEVPLWGKYRNSLQASSADLSATREAMHDVKVTLLADVANSYVSLRVLQQRLLVARQNLATQQSTLKLVESRVRAGLAGELDASQARSNVHNTASQIPALQQQARITLNGLCVLLGRPATPAIDRQVGLGVIP